MANDKENITTDLEGGSYEIIATRLKNLSTDLLTRIENLNKKRKEIFGALESHILKTDRIITANNCIPRDIINVGEYILFGYNVFIGLRKEVKINDVFSCYVIKNDIFEPIEMDFFNDPRFLKDFSDLYQYYKETRFAMFYKKGNILLMIFQIGKKTTDIKAFKWEIERNSLKYIDNRSEREYSLPDQHSFDWIKTTREDHVRGKHPHINIEDRIFVETIGGDLTIKIENNTETGEGIYSEPVINKEQTLNDAEIYYSLMGGIILLKILPYQEDSYRYIIYDEKKEIATRVDDLALCGIKLPEDHGLIFPGGYYLPSEGYKKFDIDTTDMKFFAMLGSPNGEDFLYSFYNEETGEYNLLQYNLIGKKVETPIKCNGYLIFDDGRMIFFKADNEPKKSHLIQIWQTPFVSDINFTFKDNNSLLCKIGNSSLVKGISELRQIYSLIQREKIYLSLYNDISKSVTNTLDLYYWLDKEEAFDPKEVLVEIRNNANSAINEYEKVINIKKDTQNRIFSAENDTKKLVEEYETTSFDTIQKFIDFLAVLQNKKGTIITLKDLRYSDIEKINGLESQINSKYDELSIKCIDFLLLPDSFNPLLEQLKKYNDILGTIKKVTDLKEVETEIDKLNASLDLLNEIVTNLKIEDATKTSLIIDRISNIYANLNQLKIAFKKYKIELNSKEMTVEFSSQFKLLSQNVTNFLEQANTTQKCDELLTKILIKIDELLSKFSDFDEYTEKLNLKREEIYSSFNNKRIQLNEAKNKKTINLQKNANRIFETIILKLKSFLTIDEINSYFASDLMVLKVNEIIKDLFELGDTVKSEDIASKLKSLKQDGIRQLKDKTELYNGDLIKFGNYQFTVNKEQFGLAMVEKEDEMFYHLSATDFFERVDDKDFEDTKEFWVYESGNQNQEIYRAYYLSYLFLNDIVKDTNKIVTKNEFEKIIDKKDDALKIIRDYINQIGFEGCEKGIHDEDTIKILKSVYPTYKNSGILKYHPLTRFYAVIFILFYHNIDEKNLLLNKIKSHSTLAKLLKKDANPDIIIEEIKEKMSLFYSESKIKIDQKYFALSPNYLFEELSTVDFETPFDDIKFSVNKISYDIFNSFTKYLKLQKYYDKFYSLIDNLKNDFTGKIDIIRIWVTNYFDVEVKSHNAKEFIDEIVFTLLINSIHQANFDKKIKVLDFNTICKVENLASIHSTIIENKMIFDISDFWLDNFFFHNNIVPRYKKYQSIKQSLILQKKDEMALDEFIPKILTSFVRNRLIDKVYLNIIGANLAKQIGAYGEQKRTDLMGMLLLISPPGYGKTTLMEYIAERLGLIFVKINAPALGNRVTSLDPAEAPNITAKKEIEKLNFALEMGNNVMLYVDDIQHSNPEFLQKFISLCDAQRMIEGVYKSKTKRYDFRGKKFCVVMAGNPYTESGEKFRIPDMLANRSDVYNLGDIIGSNIDDFNLSYIENSLTSNPVLNKLVSRSQSDFYELLKIAKTGVNENVSLSSKYSMEELNECVAILKKLLLVQQIILEVNKLYIYSAGQDPQYREEPQFLLQGSYRNMNKIAEKILPIINDTELKQIIEDHYRYEAQLLTTGAEFNFLRFKELSNFATPEEKTRLDSIRKTFNKNKILGKKDDKDPFGAIISQISYFNEQFGGLLDEYRKK